MAIVGDVVGAAAVEIYPVTDGFETKLKQSTNPAFGKLGKDAEKAGEESGGKLSRGFSKGTAGIASTLSGLGLPMGNLGGHLSKTAAGMGEVDSKGKGLTHTLASLGGGTLGLATAGIVGFGVAGVMAAGKYQSATATIAANAHINEASAKKISDAFLNTAGHTIYSAEAIAKAYGGVAGVLGVLNGKALTAAQAQKVMASAMDLAEGAGISLEASTQSLSKVMQAYHLAVGDSSKAADVLSSTSRETGIPVEQLATALGRVKGKLGDLAPSLGESAGLLGELAKHGATGRAAISALSGSFTTLVGGGKATTEMAKQLGLHIFDASGKFVGMKSVIEQLNPKLAGYTEQSQLQATKALFGAGANKQLLSIIQAGPAAFAASTGAVTKSGAAHERAEAQAKTFGHQVDVLKATATDLAIKFGNILIPKLVSLEHTLSDGVSWLTKHKDAAKALAIVIGTVLGGAISVFVYTKAVQFVGATKDMIKGITSFAGKVVGSTATVDAALAGTASTAETAAGSIAASETETVAAVTAADDTIATENAAASASFIGILGPIALVAGALVALKGPAEEVWAALSGTGGPEGFEQFGGNITSKGLQKTLETAVGKVEGKKRGEQIGNELVSAGSQAIHGFGSGAEPNVTRYAAIAQAAAKKYGVPASLLLADISQESGGREETSSAGAKGITQFVPGTASKYGVKYGSTQADIESQIFGQAHYLRDLGANKNPKAALEGYVSGKVGSSIGETYANSVLSKQGTYRAADTQTKALNKNTAAIEHHTASLTGSKTLPEATVTTKGKKLAVPKNPLHEGNYGFFAAAGTDYSKGEEPIIARYLGKLGESLHLHLTGVSGYRTPGHSVAVGGFPNDPHTRGEASDTPGTERISESVLNKFGLTRPFPGAKEADHIQLSAKGLEEAAKAVAKGGSGLSVAGAKFVVEAAAAVKREQAKQTADQKLGTGTLNKMVAAIHSGSMHDLSAFVGKTHEATLKKLETTLSHDHSTALEKLAAKLVATHKKVLEAWAKASLKAQEEATAKRDRFEDTIHTEEATNTATQIADATKVTLDRAAEAGKTGADLIAAQALTQLDATKQADDAAIGAAKLAVDRAVGSGEAAEAAAQQALVNTENQAKINEANAQAAVDLANNAATEAQTKATREQTEATEKATKAEEEKAKASSPTTSPTSGMPAVFNITINGAGMSSAELLGELGWQLKTGQLPVAT